MNNDLISRSALNEVMWDESHDIVLHNEYGKDEACIGLTYNEIENIIDNAPTVNEDILAEDVIKAHENIGYEKGFRDGYAQCVTDEDRQQGEWIPVSKRLPDKNMPCLVSVGKFNFTQIAMYSDLMGTIEHRIFYQGDYGKNNFQNITEYVNAWQPLPEPYKKG